MSGLRTILAALKKPLLQAAQSREGYFGWTDRYGIREPYFRSGSQPSNAAERPHFFANY